MTHLSFLPELHSASISFLGLDSKLTCGRTSKIFPKLGPVEAAEKLWKVVMSKSMEDTGKFWHREGMELTW